MIAIVYSDFYTIYKYLILKLRIAKRY